MTWLKRAKVYQVNPFHLPKFHAPKPSGLAVAYLFFSQKRAHSIHRWIIIFPNMFPIRFILHWPNHVKNHYFLMIQSQFCWVQRCKQRVKTSTSIHGLWMKHDETQLLDQSFYTCFQWIGLMVPVLNRKPYRLSRENMRFSCKCFLEPIHSTVPYLICVKKKH